MKRVLSLLLAGVLVFSLAACSETAGATGGTDESSVEVITDSSVEEVPATGASELKIGQVFYAAHGTKAFATATVVLDGDTILLAYVDEFQMSDGTVYTAVPSSDGVFGENYAPPADGEAAKVLMSKRVNAELYSAAMADKAGSTVTYDVNLDTIQAFAVGKTIAELEDTTALAPEAALEAVAGATLADTGGYLAAIVEAAKVAASSKGVSFEGETADLTLGTVYGAPHGDRSFSITSALVSGDTVLLSLIDELQFMATDTSVGVPNADVEDFSVFFVEGVVIASKRVNLEGYSAAMAANGGSTQTIDVNFDAIQDFAAGKTLAELEETAGLEETAATEAIAGSTLSGAGAYLAEIIAAAKAAK